MPTAVWVILIIIGVLLFYVATTYNKLVSIK